MKAIEGWLTVREARFLANATFYLQRLPGVIVEIGSYLGKSTIQLAQSGSVVYAIDPHKGDLGGQRVRPTLVQFRKNILKAGLKDSVVPVVNTSRVASLKWNKPIKFLYIDGLHDIDHATEDYELWSPHVLTGGIIAMHDAFCGWPGAGHAAMRHIVYSRDYKEIGVVGSIIYGVKGMPSWLDSLNKFRNQLVIELCQAIYKASWIPKRVSFFLVHRFLWIFRTNRFTLLG
jgi:MMP 1-O-methyltransferase